MSQIALNQNQFAQTPVIGQVAFQQNVDTQTCQINPNTTAPYITAGCAVKLIANTGPEIVVDATTSATDGPNFGVILFNMRGNVYGASAKCEVALNGDVVFLKSSAAINRGARVSVTNPTNTTNDPTVATDVTAGDYTIGIAETGCTAANQFVKVRIAPALNITPSTTATVVSVVSP